MMQVLLIDALNLIRRLYEALPHGPDTIHPDNMDNAAHTLERVLRLHSPSHACCVFDSRGPTWRHEIFSDYKANRKATPRPLLEALPGFSQRFQDLGIRSVSVPGFEADDVIATLAQGISQRHGHVTILSTDKGYLPLLGIRIRVYDHFNQQTYSPESVLTKYGVRHDQLIDYWALAGDPVSNIKGVPKIGAKTTQNLLQEFGTLDALFEHPPEGAVGRRILEHRDALELYRRLLQLRTDLTVGLNLKELRYPTKSA
ncbi:MAG: hypothetical protein A3I78_06485 [Gammaproteobacteria bacterium RIFCSPLOWO2_02_FULL_56_15]|nr:MAG: hypothetical protein A3I78_06485 [Gammaproteobacteria bacterium RIFCSPLOWO2_02_FULL_56_15]